jgi:hypothetical protein
VISEIRFLSNGLYILIDQSGNQIEKDKIVNVEIIEKMVLIEKVYEIINSY